jgi:hypothetical protein
MSNYVKIIVAVAASCAVIFVLLVVVRSKTNQPPTGADMSYHAQQNAQSNPYGLKESAMR